MFVVVSVWPEFGCSASGFRGVGGGVRWVLVAVADKLF